MTLSATQILDMDGTRRRRDDWRWELVDHSGETVLGLLHPSLDRPPRMTNDAEGRLGRRLTSFVIPASDRTEIDLITTALRPVLVLEDGTEYPMGLFRWAGQPNDQRSWGITRDLRLVDRTTILDNEIVRPYSWARGTQITTILDRVIGAVLPAGQFTITASPEVLYAPLAFPIGTSRLTVISDLIDKLAYLPAHFNHAGMLLVRPTPDPNLSAPQVTYTSGTRVVAGSVSGDNTLLDTPSLFMIYESSGNGTGIRATYRVPDSAPHSAARRGHEVPATEGVQGLSTYTQAGLMAVAKAIKDGRSYEYKTFSAPWDPRHDQWTIVDYYGSRWLELAWSGTCASNATQQHTIRQVYTESWVPPS